MKKLLLPLLTCLLLTGMLQAQTVFMKSLAPASTDAKSFELSDNEMLLGYCSDEIAENGVGTTKKCTMNGAIYLPADKMARYNGFKLKKICVGFVNTVTNASVWVKSALEDETLLATAALTSPKKGWNEVELNVPYNIDGSAIYIGFTITQAANSAPLSFTGEDMDKAALLSQDTYPYEDLKGFGRLSLQAVIEGDNLPQYDLTLDNVKFEKEFSDVKDGATVISTIMNNGKKTIANYEITYKLGDNELVVETVNADLAYRQSVVCTKKLPLEGLSKYNDLTVTISKVDGNADEYTADNTGTSKVYVYSQSFPRKVLLEHFTTQKCPNCPYGDAVLRESVKNRDNVIWVSHHVGYGTDIFTVKGSNDYLPFFGPQYPGGFAPAAMLDRTTMPVESYPIFNIGYPKTNVGVEAISPYFDKCSQTPAFISIDIKGEYDVNTSDLTLNITGEKTPDFEEVSNNPLLTIFLTEDELPGIQSGASGTITHEHVLRAIFTSTKGDNMIWDGNKYSCTVTGKINPTWKMADMKVIAFVNNWDSKDKTKSKVLNTEMIRLFDIPSDIQSVEGNSDVKVWVENNSIKVVGEYNDIRVFTVSGSEVQNADLTSGLYIVKVGLNSSSLIKKIIVQ